MDISEEEFERALDICNSYVVQLSQKLAYTRQRMKEIHIANGDNSRFLTAGIAAMTKDSPIEDLKHADGRLYNILAWSFEKGSTISVLETITEDEFLSIRNAGPGALKRVKGLMDITGVKFKNSI